MLYLRMSLTGFPVSFLSTPSSNMNIFIFFVQLMDPNRFVAEKKRLHSRVSRFAGHPCFLESNMETQLQGRLMALKGFISVRTQLIGRLGYEDTYYPIIPKIRVFTYQVYQKVFLCIISNETMHNEVNKQQQEFNNKY